MKNSVRTCPKCGFKYTRKLYYCEKCGANLQLLAKAARRRLPKDIVLGILGGILIFVMTGWWLFAIAGFIVGISAIKQGSLAMGLVSLVLLVIAGIHFYWLSKQKDLP